METPAIVSMYRFDTSNSRLCGSAHEQEARWRPRARRPRPAPRVAPARLRAAQAAQRAARRLPGFLLRLALPLPEGPGQPAAGSPRTADRDRRRLRRLPVAAAKIVYRLTADGKEHFAGPARRGRAGRLGGRELRRPLRVLRRRPTPTVRMRILEGRRSRLEERLDSVRAAGRGPASGCDGYTLELSGTASSPSSARSAGSTS